MINTIDVPMSGVISGLTLHVRVTGIKVYAVRFWLGTQVMKLAAIIMGCGIKIEMQGRSAKISRT